MEVVGSSSTDTTGYMQRGSGDEEPNELASYSKAYPILDDLLASAARSLKIERLCLLLSDTPDNAAVLATFPDSTPPRGARYRLGSDDLAIDINYRGSVLGKLVAKDAPGSFEVVLLHPFALSAGFIMGALRDLVSEEAPAQQAAEIRVEQNVLEQIVAHYPGLLAVMEEPPICALYWPISNLPAC